MLRQPRNAKRASRACKVGQLGLEQLDVRVVPSATAVAPLAAGPAALYNPPQPPKQPSFDVKFDENGKIQGGSYIKGTNIYKLDNPIDLSKYKGNDVWVGVYEQKTSPPPKKGDHSDDHGPPEKVLSDVIHIYNKTEYDWDKGRFKSKQVTYVQIWSDKEYGEKWNPFDVGVGGFKDKKFDIPTQEQGKEDNNWATFDVRSGRGDKFDKEISFYFQSDGKLKTKYGDD